MKTLFVLIAPWLMPFLGPSAPRPYVQAENVTLTTTTSYLPKIPRQVITAGEPFSLTFQGATYFPGNVSDLRFTNLQNWTKPSNFSAGSIQLTGEAPLEERSYWLGLIGREATQESGKPWELVLQKPSVTSDHPSPFVKNLGPAVLIFLGGAATGFLCFVLALQVYLGYEFWKKYVKRKK